ncbi:hypothetical protein ScPMuIL_009103, partial [Solemya velum]
MFCCTCAKESSDDELFQERKNTPNQKEDRRESPTNGETKRNSELNESETKCVKLGDSVSNHQESKDPEPKFEVSETIEAVETQKNFTVQQAPNTELESEEEIMSKELTTAVSRLEAVASRLENLAKCQQEEGGAKVSSEPEVMAESVIAFENLIAAHIKKYVELSHVIGGDVQTQADLVQQAFQAQKEFLVQASRSKLPSQNVLMELLKPTSEKIQAIVDCREKNRRSNFFNHLSAISESVPCLGWVNVSPTPGPFVKDMADAGTFYSNRVLMEYKGKDQNHVDWTKSWTSALTELQAFIKEYHRTGLEWNSSVMFKLFQMILVVNSDSILLSAKYDDEC